MATSSLFKEPFHQGQSPIKLFLFQSHSLFSIARSDDVELRFMPEVEQATGIMAQTDPQLE